VQRDKLKTEMRRINEQTYYKQYMLDDSAFEMEKLKAKDAFLSLLLNLEQEPIQFTCKDEEEEVKGRGKLPDFDDIHCDYKSELNMPMIGSFRMECNKMTTHLGGGPLSLELKENLDTNEVIRGTVEVGYSKKLGGVSVNGGEGPLSAELEGSVGGFVEFDNNGVTDVGVKAGAEVKVGSDISGTVTGAEARYGWNSGGSLKGKGLLEGIDIH
jgi:hypothetical protein